MKIWAKVKLKEEQAGLLIRSFFKEFHPESMISIKGNEAEVEIFFENEPPQGIVDAISKCGEIELKYSPDSEEVEEKEEKSSTKTKKEKGKNKAKIDDSKTTVQEIPDLNQIARKSNSYEEFIQKVADLLKLANRRELFVKSVGIASELKGRISWPNIADKLTIENFNVNDYERGFCNKRVSAAFKGTIGLMQLIKQIIEYRNYGFSNKEQLTSGEPVTQQGIFDLPCFQELIDCVDDTQPVDERVRTLLNAIGLNQRTGEEQHRILEVVNMAIKMKDIDFDAIGEKLEISTEDISGARMILSELLNVYIASNAPSVGKIKAIDFLKELQKVIMTQQEIDNLVS